MSAAAVSTTATPAKGRKKLIVIAVAVIALLAAAAGGFMVYKSRAAEAMDDEDEMEVVEAKPKKGKQGHHGENFDPKHAPIYLPLEVITCNLADREIDRYAQVSLSLELVDKKVEDQVKAFMPAIRNNLLMVLTSKTAEDVRTEQGKKLLMAELLSQVLRPLGFDLDAQELLEQDGESHAAKGKRKHKPQQLPVRAVHFSNFIVQ